MQSKAATVEEYLASLPPERRAAISAVRDVIRENLDKDMREVMQYGMIGYCVPHDVYPDGYHCNPKEPLPVAGLGNQKNHMSLYLMAVYGNEAEAKRFQQEWKKSGKKLDMGKACIRFKKLEDLPLEVIAGTFQRLKAKDYIKHYEANIRVMNKRARRS
jgi:hypothetical protein